MIINNQPKSYVIAVKDVEISEIQVAEFMSSAKEYQWDVEIFWGIDGYSDDVDDKAREFGIKKFFGLANTRPGMKGCLLSHWSLWKKCVETDTPLIIFEHDAVIHDKWRPIEVGDYILKLHHVINIKERFDPLSGVWTSSAYAYYIPPSQASKLIEFSTKNGALPSDVVMGDKVIELKHFDGEPMVHRNTVFSTTRLPGTMYNNPSLNLMRKTKAFIY